MAYLLLGLVIVVVVALALHGFTNANPGILAKRLKAFVGVVSLFVAVVLAARGMIAVAAPAGMLGVWLLWGGGSALPSSRKSSGQTSQVVTDTLEMELDHDTGDILGVVRRGMFAGQRIESLQPAELALLWQDCRADDPQSAQLIEAYLDRAYPTWREDVRRGEQEMRGPDGRMSPDEAYEILGLKFGASDDEIRKAHRELMLRFHPDRGGSTYLASKINEAKDVLLRGRD